MKKILLIVTALILAGIGAAGASGYFAAISNQGTVTVTATDAADLSLAINLDYEAYPEYSISRDVASYAEGDNQTNPYIVLDFGDMQPWSTYQYKDILIIRNNKPYIVYASATVEGSLANNPNFCMAIAIAPYCWQWKTTAATYKQCACCQFPWWGYAPFFSNIVYRGSGGFMHDGVNMTCPPGCCHWGQYYGTVMLWPDMDYYVSFCLMTDDDKYNTAFATLDGSITFTASRTQPGIVP